MAAQKGNNHAGNALVAKKALEHAMLDYQGEKPTGEKVSKFKALVEIWKAQLVKAIDGDTQSAAMIVDRLDGKPRQSTELSGPDGAALSSTFEFVPVSNEKTNKD